MTEIGSLVLFAADPERAAAFYQAIGLDLDHEAHEDGPAHHAVEIGTIHFAIYPADSTGRAPARRGAGSSFAGFYVDSLDATAAALAGLSTPVMTDHEQMPWGCRMVVEDPDGRPVEINQRQHCG